MQVRARIGTFASHLDVALQSAGWRDDHGRRWQRWRLRSRPLCLDVTSLPALTSVTLAMTGLDIARIRDIRYRIDVTGLLAADISTDDFAPTGAN
jgi:hypothetical protein